MLKALLIIDISWVSLMKIYIILAVFLISTFAGIANAADKPAAIQLNVAAGDVSKQIDTILEAVGTSEYIEMSKSERSELSEKLSLIESETLDAAAIETTQKQVNKILTEAFADSRLVCSNRKVIGTNKKAKSCMTVADKRAAREKTKNELNQNAIQQTQSGQGLNSNN
jgi:hypothetical protein